MNDTVEVVIRIPTSDYFGIRRDVENGFCNGDNAVDDTFRAIADGTVLPKGHGALVDIDKPIYCCKYKGEGCVGIHCEKCSDYAVSYKDIHIEPTVIEADREVEG